MIMDPRVKSIEDAKRGIKNLDAWNWEHALSPDDKARHMVCYVYFLVWFVFLTYCLTVV